MSCLGYKPSQRTQFKLGGDHGSELREVLAQAMMEYSKISSYRAIVASTTAILNTEHHGHKPLEDDGIGDILELKALDHRQYLVCELLRTEREYFLHLQKVLDGYAEPFRKFTSLSLTDHRVLFVGLEPIMSLSAMITSKLDEAVQSWDPTSTKIGNLFSSKYWNHYEDYADRYGDIKGTLEDKYKNDESFVEFLELRGRNSEFTLEELLQLPVQRIPEYDKYLNELLQETDPGHPDYDHLSRAAAKVRNMVKEREDELGNMDNQKRIERVQDKFPFDDLQLRDMDLQRRQLASRRKSAPGAVLFKTLGKSKSTNNILTQNSMGKKEMEFLRPTRQHNNFNRQYLMEGNVEFSRGMQTQDRYLFLFSDLLLVAKQKSNTTFKLKHRIRVCELWLAYCIDDITELTRPADRSFVIGWPTINVVATFKSLELKETWLNKLKEQIEEERAKQLPKTLSLDVHYRDSDKACQMEVEPTTETVSIVKTCLEQLAIPDNESKDFQLWVKAGQDDSPYPLCGHELPYAIKQSHIRDYAKRSEDSLTALEIQRYMSDMQGNNRKYEFFLKHNKKSPKKQSLEESSAKSSKGKRKSPLISLFRRHRDEKKPQGKLFGHQLANVTTPENLIAKPVKELLTILFREGPYTVGILRKSCNAKMSKDLKARLDEGEDCLGTGEWPSLVIGALVKDYLRSIPQSLLMEDLYEDWVLANDLMDPVEKNNKLKDTLGKLTPPHYDLLRHLICVLYHIDQKSEENKMTAYNLSVCIAPSLLWPKSDPNPLATPPAVIQYMIENCPQVFGEECVHLFGEIIEQKIRQDSSTDSDSMHSVLSTHSNFRRDDSSIDSLDREMLYTRDIDSSPHIVKSHHFSPSNLSGDSGLTLSDSQLYDENENGNDIINDRRNNYIRSNSQYTPRDIPRNDGSDTSRSLDNQYIYQYDPQNPVRPPRRTRRKGYDPNQSPNMECDRKQTRYTSQMNFNVPGRYDKRLNQVNNENNKFKRRSTESLKSVEESSEADSEMNMKDYRQRDIGTLIKSASGAHLYFEEINNQSLFEFDNLNRVGKHGSLYKQTSDGTTPMSPQSKYSLSSSRDSVLSDSSGSFLNRQNSPDPLSSSAETPDQEDRGMSQWLLQQSKHTAFMRQARISQDDSEVGLKMDKKPNNNVSYLVSPKSSPKLKRREPIPLSVRRSFPLQTEIVPRGSGSNTSKEAEDIIKSPKLTVTYCSQDSLDKRCDSSPKAKVLSPHLDIYNNNSQMAMKQLNIYSSGLQGTSPPPRVVLQGLSSQAVTQKRDNTPVKGNHNILSQERRSSLDMGEFRQRKTPYPMQENSVSTEEDTADSESSESETEEYEFCSVTTIFNVPLKYNLPKKIVVEDKKSSSSESLSRSSNNSEDNGSALRPENPPNYEEAMQRNYLLKSGYSPAEVADMDSETLKQREASMRAKQLYEQSMRQYQERERYSLPSQQFAQKLDVLGEKHEEHSSEEEEVDASSDEEQTEGVNDPRKLYEESLRRYMEEQLQSRSPLVKSSSQDDGNISFSKTKGGQEPVPNKHLLGVSSLKRSNSDVINMKNHRSPAWSSGSSRTSSQESTPTKRPEQPPPYNDPPPYRSEHAESSPSSVERHYFRKAGEYFYTPDAQSITSKTHEASAVESIEKTMTEELAKRSSVNAQIISVPKRRDNILVSNRARNFVTTNTSQREQSKSVHMDDVVTDHTIHSAQSEIGKYRSSLTNIRSRDTSLESNRTMNNSSPSVSQAVSQSKQSDLSVSVFRSRSSSLEPSKPRNCQTPPPKNSTHGPISYRNPSMSKSSVEVTRSQNIQSNCERSPRRGSLDAAVTRASVGRSSATKELPWSVKSLSSIFNQNKSVADNTTQLQSQSPSFSSNSSSSTLSSSTLSSSSHQRVPPPYTPPPVFQRHMIDNMRSSTSSNSSISSSGTARNLNGRQSHKKFGPQTRDSFSSADGSDCSCRYSLNNCRRDNSSIEDLENISFTDITYV